MTTQNPVFKFFRHDLQVYYKRARHITKAFLHFLPNYVRLKNLRKKIAPRKLVNINLVEHIGDIVTCEPVARHVRKTNPGAFVVWTCKKQYLPLVASNPDIDLVLPVFCLTEWLLMCRAKLFDKTFNLHFTDVSCPACLIPVGEVSGNHGVTARTYFTNRSLLAAFCESAGVPLVDADPVLHIPETARNDADKLSLPERYVAVQTVANERQKEWGETRWKKLIEEIIATTGHAVVEIGKDQPRHGVTNPMYRKLCGKPGIMTSAEVIRRSTVFVGTDSGPAHIANALGTFSVIILGSYKWFGKYMPFCGRFARGERCAVLRAEKDLDEIGVGETLAAVKRGLENRP
jgi:heptosyltransferase-3